MFCPFLKELKVAEFWHMDLVLLEKHCSEVFFSCWVALHFQKLMQKPWNLWLLSFFKVETKEVSLDHIIVIILLNIQRYITKLDSISTLTHSRKLIPLCFNSAHIL